MVLKPVSAFPLPQFASAVGRRGMDLRDYFAAVAFGEFIAKGYPAPTTAQMAYEYANAMMKEREAKA